MIKFTSILGMVFIFNYCQKDGQEKKTLIERAKTFVDTTLLKNSSDTLNESSIRLYKDNSEYNF